MSYLTQYLLGITNSKCISKGCGKGSVSFSKRFVWGWWELSKIEICQKKVFLGKIHHSSVGGATPSRNPYNSRESPYWRKRFFTCPFDLPKDSEKSTIENFLPPLQDALKIFRPPSRAVENFSTPPGDVEIMNFP